MNSLKGNLVSLRALEPSDLEFLYSIENEESFWLESGVQKPYSKHVLQQYIQNSHLDIYEIKQLRFVIENKQKEVVGLVDLFDFNPQHLRAGVGIIIQPNFQKNGYAFEALKLMENYAFTHLSLVQIYANIVVDNSKSVSLFKKLKYQKVGVRKNWVMFKNQYIDVAFYQLLKE